MWRRRRAAKLDPETEWLREMLALLLAMNEAPQEARDVIREALPRAPLSDRYRDLPYDPFTLRSRL